MLPRVRGSRQNAATAQRGARQLRRYQMAPLSYIYIRSTSQTRSQRPPSLRQGQPRERLGLQFRRSLHSCLQFKRSVNGRIDGQGVHGARRPAGPARRDESPRREESPGEKPLSPQDRNAPLMTLMTRIDIGLNVCRDIMLRATLSLSTQALTRIRAMLGNTAPRIIFLQSSILTGLARYTDLTKRWWQGMSIPTRFQATADLTISTKTERVTTTLTEMCSAQEI